MKSYVASTSSKLRVSTFFDSPNYVGRPLVTLNTTTPLTASRPDIITDVSGYKGIYAMYRKVYGYVGYLYLIIRASDSTMKDCYTFEEMRDFLSGTTGKVVTWYDQSGNGNHFTQSTDGNRPSVTISDGSIRGRPSFDLSTAGGMTTPSASNVGNNAFIAVAGYTNYTSGNRVFCGVTNNWLLGPYGGSVYQTYDSSFSGGPNIQLNVAKVHVAWKSGSGGVTQNRVNSIGGYSSSGGVGPGQYALATSGSFGESGGSRIFELLVKAATTYSATDVQAMERLTNSYYNIF